MSKNYGKVGWNDNTNKKTNKFVTLENGANTVRMISDVYKYFIHKVKFKGDSAKWGRTIKCAVDNCPLCKENNEAKAKYIAGVLVGNEVKFLDMGPGLYNEISGLANNMPGYEEPKDYNINIVRNPKGGATGFYKAYPADKTTLTAEQIAAIETDFDEEELEKFIQPPEPEEVNKSIERIAAWISKSKEPESSDDGDNAPTKESTVSDGDYDFVVKRS